MLSKVNRLKQKNDFDFVFRKGKSVRGDSFVLRFAVNNLSCSRFGFVVGKVVSNKATARNNLKRKLRAVVRPIIKQIKTGLDIVLVTKPGLEVKKQKELKDILAGTFQKAGLLRRQ